MNAQEFFNSMRYFGEPKVPENSNYPSLLKTYLVGLGRYSSDVLQAASDKLVATRNHRNFPLLAECLQACRDVQNEFAEQRRDELAKGPAKSKVDLAWSTERIKAAERMMASDIGQRAAVEGWIIALHDFCREHARLPQGAEATQVRLEALARKRQREIWAEDANSKQALAMIASATRARETKSKRLSAIALGKDAA